MKEQRPFYRVFTVTKQEAAVQQIEAAIAAFSAGHFAVTITLAGAAEDMAPEKANGLWTGIRDNPTRPVPESKVWVGRLNETRNWLKHDRAEDTRALVSFEAGLFILRAMDKWEPWTPPMLAFRDLWFSSPKLMRPEDYSPEVGE
ncbi:MAG: hypothetical protein E5Y65_26010 [Mesorhizobium sp.]|uniref:hypothetical protein n=1 Tax=Mesorhizobium sp. TaxID=1871066 RepID=UPI001200DBD0|nr:hypothetical protein [Mesorhizobium sp.]TIL72285.1 MAG: hypothetical protein E5Y70_22490 [Mesorhizobium sp.]TIL86605.1 MAG: hypothetical protein E5Y65_26010 [Mesorhizobium sp.]TIL98394.1 MAG: hypothetical protein E5Y64_26510 [Mesorhizobium sp.]TIM34045.1 MAG: hypothetical protein E5Y61_13990 [Mesorhizobium sp.]TIM80865.1 MAG: hypothetical protein E5Y60_01670 [Mesorhizobium sp.]